MTERERALGYAVLGETLNMDKVRVTHQLGLRPLPPQGQRKFYKIPADRVNCLPPPRKSKAEIGPPVAYVGFHTIHYTHGNYRRDLLATWGPDGVPINEILTLAHEFVHVWQWQNREITGYHPWRGFREGLVNIDPYAYEVTAGRPFLEYGYEQQARIVEDYLCLTIVDPRNPQRKVLEEIMAPHFPVERVLALIQNPPGGAR